MNQNILEENEILKNISKDGSKFQFIRDELKNDKEFILKAIEKNIDIILSMTGSGQTSRSGYFCKEALYGKYDYF